MGFVDDWGDVEKSLLETFKTDLQKGGYLYQTPINGGSELNRAFNLVPSARIAAALGWLDIARKYSEVGLSLLDTSIKKRQKKLSITTLVPSSLIDYHRNSIRNFFGLIINRKDDPTLQEKIFVELYSEFSRLIQESKLKIANRIRPVLCSAAIANNRLDLAYLLAKEINKQLAPKITNEKDIVLNDWYLIELTIECLTNSGTCKYSIEDINNLYMMFFNYLTVPGQTGFHKTLNGRRPISTLYVTAYLFYKYVNKDVPFDPVLVLQSTVYGYVSKVIEKKL